MSRSCRVARPLVLILFAGLWLGACASAEELPGGDSELNDPAGSRSDAAATDHEHQPDDAGQRGHADASDDAHRHAHGHGHGRVDASQADATDGATGADAHASAEAGLGGSYEAGLGGGYEAGPAEAGPTEAGPTEAGPTVDGGTHDAGVLPDLVLELPSGSDLVSFREQAVSEGSCELFEGCVSGTGQRTLMELSFTLRNLGAAPLVLGKPYENPLFHASLCQQAYTLAGFFDAALRDAAGQVVASASLATSCVAAEGSSFSCVAQGLSVGGSSAQPESQCDFVDITGIPQGRYTLEISVNADRRVGEANFDNNRATQIVDYPACAQPLCGGLCCPDGVGCVGGRCDLPDLRANRAAAAHSLWLKQQSFASNSCELGERCVSGSGLRRLLEFEGRIDNLGPADLSPGDPRGNPLFEYSACHDHYHFLNFTDYKVFAADGALAASGHKQSFCLISMEEVANYTGPASAGTHPEPNQEGCNNLIAGWSDVYAVDTPCQWVDVTDVPPGEYVLQVSVNPIGAIAETATANNIVRIPFHMDANPGTACAPTAELCGDAFDQDCDGNPDDWDPDCWSGCLLGDVACQEAVPEAVVVDNDRCSQARPLMAQGTYEGSITATTASDAHPNCGGEGGDLFFRFSLPTPRIVYLGTLDSELDTVLSVQHGSCDGAEVHCVDDACNGVGAHFAELLDAGNYIVAVKAKTAGSTGRVKLKFQTAHPGAARWIGQSGTYVGSTLAKGDSVEACDGRTVFAREEVYALPSCGSELTVAVCGSDQLEPRVGLRFGSLADDVRACGTPDPSTPGCAEHGTTLRAHAPSGLAFVVVEGSSAQEAGPYRMSVAF